MSTGEWGHMTGAAGVVDSLRRSGVRRVFGIPSAETSLLFDAFQRSPIEIVLTTHEQCATFMADAHTRVTGELGACLLSPGPGLANALAGIATARSDSIPMVVLVAGPETKVEDHEALEDSQDHLAMAGPVCKGVLRVDEPEEVPMILARAVRLAQENEPGPVLVEIPREVQRRSARLEGTGFRPGPRILDPEAEKALDLASEMIITARTVGIYAGAGCFTALEELAELAEKLEAPVASTISGLGVLPFVHPLSVGFGPGPASTPLAERAFRECELVLAVGCKFSEAATGGRSLAFPQKLVHIDIEPTVVARNRTATVKVAAPAKLALRFLLDRVVRKRFPGLSEIIRAGKRELRQELTTRPAWTDAVDPVKFFLQLREMLATEDVLILDSGHHAFFGLAAYQVLAPRTLIMPVDYRALGFAVPAAVAAKLALPDVRVVACVGDGGFQLTAFELLTARRCNISPVVVVFADEQLGYVRAYQERLLGRETCVDLVPVAYQELAKALGVGHVCIRNDSELKAGLKRALTTEAPVIVELRVAYREAAPYLRAVLKAEWQRLPRATTLKLGARLILRRILGMK